MYLSPASKVHSFRIISRSSGKYVIIANVFSLSIAFYVVYLSLIFALQHTEIMVYCEPGDMIQGEVYLLASLIIVIVTLATTVIYVIMGIMLKVIRSDQNNSNNSSQSQIEITHRIFKSLAVIMAVIFWLWFFGFLLGNIVGQGLITSDPSLQFLITRLVSQLVTFAGAINAPVLYFCSSEYREIIKSEFPWIKFLLCSNNYNPPVVVVAAGPQIIHSSNKQMQNK